MPRRHSGSAAVLLYLQHVPSPRSLRRALRVPFDSRERQRAASPSPRVSSPPAQKTARQPGVRSGPEALHVHGPLVPGGCSDEGTQQAPQ